METRNTLRGVAGRADFLWVSGVSFGGWRDPLERLAHRDHTVRSHTRLRRSVAQPRVFMTTHMPLDPYLKIWRNL
jgi:hypothetical protein